MSKQELNSDGASFGGPSVVVYEQSVTSGHNAPFRPTELHEEMPQDSLHKRSKAPAIPSVTELKDSENPDATPREESESVFSSEKYKQKVVKKHSSHALRRESSPETIKITALEIKTKKESIMPSSQPIPVLPTVSTISSPMEEKTGGVKKGDEDSITEEISEMRTPEPAKKSSEWSDEEEAGGLPRSESRASRISRALRQLFCCGVAYQAPSEGNVSTPRGFNSGI